MSLAALNQVYDEMRRLAIAGGSLASGDFRLKKLVDPLKGSAAKAPVFGKVAEAVEKVVGAPARETAPALLELSTLVTAILYTQGEMGAEGKLEPVPTTDFGLPSSNTSARVLKPLLEALTTTGSGREEIIKDAHQRGAFKDLRLVRPALGAIDDVYQPIADFVAREVLPMYGKAIYDDLVKDYSPKAKGGAVRRLKLMHRLDPEQTRAHVQAALDGGSADMKVTAIECLEGSQEALPFLLEQAKARNNDVRRAALGAMGTLTDPEVVETLIQVLISTDYALAVGPASRNRSPKLLDFLLGEAEKQLAELFAPDKKKPTATTNSFYILLECFNTRTDAKTIAFLTKCFEARDKIGRLDGDVDGMQVNRRVASLLLKSRLKPVLAKLVEAHATLPPQVLGFAWLASCQSRTPKETYDLFAPHYLDQPVASKRKKKEEPVQTKRDAVRQVVKSFAERRQPGRYYYYGDYFGGHDFWLDGEMAKDEVIDGQLDPRWLDAAIETDDVELVLTLARPKHSQLQTYLEQLPERSNAEYDLADVYETMIRIEHPRGSECMIDALKRLAASKANRNYLHHHIYRLARLIPLLPKSAAPALAEWLATLDDQAADLITPYLAELQAKP